MQISNKARGNIVTLAVVLTVAQFCAPTQYQPLNYVPAQLRGLKPLETVTLQQAMNRATAGDNFSVSVLYMAWGLPSTVREELAGDMQAWRKTGAAVHAFSIDPVGETGAIPRYAKRLGKDVAPVWIRMPGGDACALEQVKAVSAFAKMDIDPESEIPLLTLVLRNGDGRILKTHFVIVPNGGEFDPEVFNHALVPFDLAVRKTLR